MLRRNSAGGVQPNLNLTLVQQIAVPLPPLGEQQEILRQLEEKLSAIVVVETEVDKGITRVHLLRQSILKRAFEGKLVPQDPNDEPASVLLERIQAARAAEQSSQKRSPMRKGNGQQSQRSAKKTAPSQDGKKKSPKRDLFAELSEGFDALKRERDV